MFLHISHGTTILHFNIHFWWRYERKSSLKSYLNLCPLVWNISIHHKCIRNIFMVAFLVHSMAVKALYSNEYRILSKPPQPLANHWARKKLVELYFSSWNSKLKCSRDRILQFIISNEKNKQASIKNISFWNINSNSPSKK